MRDESQHTHRANREHRDNIAQMSDLAGTPSFPEFFNLGEMETLRLSSMGLSYIAEIVEINKIQNADRIEAALVNCHKGGKWRGVVGKGQFTVGDKAQVFLQDAIVPQIPELAFMEKSKWIVRMARFKGVPSECVIIQPVVNGEVGEDVTEKSGVVKYDKPLPEGTEAIAPFPNWIPKTDEPNFQSVPEIVEALRGEAWYATLKYDGSSCTAWNELGDLHVASRNWELRDGYNVYWRAARDLDLFKLPERYAVQFEVYGEGVQGNPLGVKGVHGAVFNVYDRRSHRFLDLADTEALATDHGFETVSQVAAGTSFEMSEEQIRMLAESAMYPNSKPAEGVVFRSSLGLLAPTGDRISFKSISLKYK